MRLEGCLSLQNDFDATRLWRPETKMRFVRADQFRTDWVASLDRLTTFASLRRAPALDWQRLRFHLSGKDNMRTLPK